MQSSSSVQRTVSKKLKVIKEMSSEVYNCYFMHLRVELSKACLVVAQFIIKLTCTVFVVPLSKQVGRMFDCDLDAETGVKHLSYAPDIVCYEGKHLKLCLVGWIVIPAFFFLLLPYTVCGGDATYVQRDEILNPSLWRGNAEKKVSVRYTGFLHANKKNFFITQLTLFGGKVVVPLVVQETTTMPRLQNGLLVSVSFIIFMVFVWCPPMVSRRASGLLQGSKCLTTYAMLCAGMTVYIADDSSMVPAYAMFVGTAVLAFIFLIMYKMTPRMKFDSVALSSDEAEAFAMQRPHGP